MTHYPFNADRQQVDIRHCPAPHCGRDMLGLSVWVTAISFADDERDFYDDVATFDAALAYEPRAAKFARLCTCTAPACVAWARLRSEDLRAGEHGDPRVQRWRWMTSPYYRGERA